MKYSVIIPVYNSEQYIRRCLKSVFDQEYDDVEIIAIDDGSTDSSLRILNSFSDQRLKVISIENGGVSNARNIGLRKAEGEYVLFVDSDDYLASNCFQTLDKIISAEHDIYAFCYCITTTKDTAKEVKSDFAVSVVDADDAIRYSINPSKNPLRDCRFNTVWAKAFRREFLVLNNIFFNTKLNVGEDSLFFMEAASKCDSIIFMNYYMYYYFINQASITHTYRKNMYNNECEWQKCLRQLMENKKMEDKEKLISYCLFKGMLNCIFLNVLYRDQSFKRKELSIKQLAKSDLYQGKSLNKNVWLDFTSSDRIVLSLMSLKMYWIIVLAFEIKNAGRRKSK